MKTLLTAIMMISATFAARAQGTFDAMIVSGDNPVGGVFPGVAGWTFQTLYPVTLTDLGCFQTVIDGNGTAIRVGLWANDGTLLVSRVVSSTSPLINTIRYEPVDSLLLQPNVTYHLGAYSSSGSIGLNLAGPGYSDYTLAPALDPTSIHRTENVSGFAAPSVVPGSLVFPVGADVRYSAVPEPSALALLALGGVAMIWRGSRRR